MAKVFAATLLLIWMIRALGPAMHCMQDFDIKIALQEQDKSHEPGAKEKVEEEQPLFEPVSTTATLARSLSKYYFLTHQVLPTHHAEPSCPPPDIAHS